ncbi:unnamed protein product [Ilex paraguariensis]|uniref:Uncharacterized protein n=1 Tax=Ilex paraguariensis TaxID=185542 RepID=A0ABC8QWJ6_9AQUA
MGMFLALTALVSYRRNFSREYELGSDSGSFVGCILAEDWTKGGRFEELDLEFSGFAIEHRGFLVSEISPNGQAIVRAVREKPSALQTLQQEHQVGQELRRVGGENYTVVRSPSKMLSPEQQSFQT